MQRDDQDIDTATATLHHRWRLDTLGLVMFDITHSYCHLPSQLYIFYLYSHFILLTLVWPELWAAILSICCKTKPWCSLMQRTTWWRKWKMMINMRDSYGLIKIDRGAARFVIVSAIPSQSSQIFSKRSFPLQVYKLNWNILLSVSCSFVKVDGEVHGLLYILWQYT